MKIVLVTIILLSSLIGFSKPTVIIYVEKRLFDDAFLVSLQHEFLENFKVDYKLIQIEDVGREIHLIESIIDGSILTNHGIVNEAGSYRLFLTNKPLYFENNPLAEIRGFTAFAQTTSIVSTHKIRDESLKLGLPFEFQFIKTVKHEFLHLMGLGHCDQSIQCMMISSYPPSNFYTSMDRICSLCLAKIDTSIVILPRISMAK